jgi:hypothetical protein
MALIGVDDLDFLCLCDLSYMELAKLREINRASLILLHKEEFWRNMYEYTYQYARFKPSILSFEEYYICKVFEPGTAMATKNIRIINALVRYRRITLHDVAENAALEGHLDVLKWCVQMRTRPPLKCSRPHEDMKLVNIIAARGHLTIVQFLHDDCDYIPDVYGMCMAARSGKFDVVKWLSKYIPLTTDMANYAVKGGNFEMVKWVVEHKVTPSIITANEAWSPNEETFFIGRPSTITLEILQYLDEMNVILIRVVDMTYGAAYHGMIDVLEWLESKEIHCTEETANFAAMNGQTKTLEWLGSRKYLFKISGICAKWKTKKAVRPTNIGINIALSNGHIETIDFIRQRFALFPDINGVYGAINNKKWDSVLWALKYKVIPGSKKENNQILQAVIQANNMKMYDILLDHGLQPEIVTSILAHNKNTKYRVDAGIVITDEVKMLYRKSIMEGDVSIVRLLIQLYKITKDDMGDIDIFHIMKSGRLEMLEIFKTYGIIPILSQVQYAPVHVQYEVSSWVKEQITNKSRKQIPRPIYVEDD